MKFHLFVWLLFSTCLAYAQNSQQWVGKWAGTLESNGSELQMMFEISVKNSGWYCKLSVPSQSVVGTPFSVSTIEKKSISLQMEYPEASFSGKITDSNTIKGYWLQNKHSTPLVLKKVWGIWPVPKPQTPTKPYSWVSEEVRISAAGGRIMLAGELDKPDSVGKFPVVIFISGSGAQDRDATMGQHKMFLVLTQLFISKGYAVLRCDDRGAGKTKGHLQTMINSTSADLAQDVVEMVNFLHTRTDIDTQKLGLLGHSEGAMIAPYVAARNSKIKFIIMLASPAAGGLEANSYQNKVALQKQHFKEKDIQSFLNIHKSLLRNICSLSDTTGWTKLADSLVNQWLSNGSTKKARYILFQGKKQDVKTIHKNYQTFLLPWWKFFMQYDPTQDLDSLRIPALALNGGSDQQVPCDPNLNLIRLHNPDIEAHCIPYLNHMFQNCTSCDIPEALAMDQTISKNALAYMEKWLEKQKP